MPFHHSDFNSLEIQHQQAIEDRKWQQFSNSDEQRFTRESWQEILARKDHRRKILRRFENAIIAVGILLVLSMAAWIGPVARLVTGWFGVQQ